ncbi:hypothetical protein [Sanguibacter sp. HDW7]|uniref:hypothetical protein n=1 Tax=Sanguibacter sp. HDW7 TaxID=2714931 RepID=UPI0014083E15|nr:hypothetical protein [Sanguibacter sp. HDW7]QIK82936.1 hypothetical protein G7063_04320 [Sanguibacter sp. HDW7]
MTTATGPAPGPESSRDEGRDPLGGLTLSRVLGALRLGTRLGPEPRGGRGRATADPALPDDALPDDALLDDACARALRAGHSPVTVVLLREAWDGLGPEERLRVAAPLADDAPTWRGQPAIQVDGTTCGAAVGAMLAAAGDPVVALALETGTVLAGVVDPRLGPLVAAAAQGFDALQRYLHAATTRRVVLGLLPWPRRLGTPPWGLAREARCADVRFRHVVVDVADRTRTSELAARIDVCLRAGTPLPLFTGGASRSGWSTALPRHVVLLTGVESAAAWTGVAPGADGGTGPGAPGASWRVYEPSRGRVLTVDARTWAVPERRDAWGRWSRPHWIVLPR